MGGIADCIPASETVSDFGDQIYFLVVYSWTDTFRCRTGDEIPRRINSGWRKRFEPLVIQSGAW